MTLNELLQTRELSRYSLSEKSGVPWAILSDLCSGRTKFEQCSAATLSKLSKALKISMEELLLLETGDRMGGDGKPKDKEYLETGLPNSLQHVIDEFVQGEKEQVSHMDCLWGGTVWFYQCMPVGRQDYRRAGRLSAEKISVWRRGGSG